MHFCSRKHIRHRSGLVSIPLNLCICSHDRQKSTLLVYKSEGERLHFWNNRRFSSCAGLLYYDQATSRIGAIRIIAPLECNHPPQSHFGTLCHQSSVEVACIDAMVPLSHITTEVFYLPYPFLPLLADWFNIASIYLFYFDSVQRQFQRRAGVLHRTPMSTHPELTKYIRVIKHCNPPTIPVEIEASAFVKG